MKVDTKGRRLVVKPLLTEVLCLSEGEAETGANHKGKGKPPQSPVPFSLRLGTPSDSASREECFWEGGGRVRRHRLGTASGVVRGTGWHTLLGLNGECAPGPLAFMQSATFPSW